MKKKLTPTTHILKSKRNRAGFELGGALMELCDNALDHGQAETIYITIDSQSVIVRDDGSGVDDVNRIFQFGSSSSYEDQSKNSQFGIGATDAAVFLGDVLEVKTVRDGRYYEFAVDWGEVEHSGDWPEMYTGRGIAFGDVRDGSADFPLAQGTKVMISKLHDRRTRPTVERVVVELGRKFAPALRANRKIHVTYMAASGPALSEWVKPYEPPELSGEVEIGGQVDTARGPMRWRGRAGLSDQLTKEDNQVHFIFGHRVIESNRNPFKGTAAGTLYVEIELLAEDGWKYALSDHKDRIVKYRADLFESVHVELGDLLKQAEERAHHIALRLVIAPIEEKLTKALRGVGVLHVDPSEEPEHGEGEGGRKKRTRVKSSVEDGEPAKPAKAPTGVRVEYRNADQLKGKLWDWKVGEYELEVDLLEDHFRPVFGFPPDSRDWTFINIIVSFLAHGVEMEYWGGDEAVLKAFKPRLQRKIKDWAENNEIAPRFHAAVMHGLQENPA